MGKPIPVSSVDHQERRGDARHTLVLKVGILEQGGRSFLCIVRNVSSTGVQLKIYARPDSDCDAEIRVADEQPIRGRIVWIKGDAAGMRFDEELDPSVLLRVRHKLEQNRRRSMPRLPLQMAATMRTTGKRSRISIMDISSLGVRIGTQHPLSSGIQVVIELADLPPMTAFVRWSDGEESGLVFAIPIPMQILAHWIDGRFQLAA